MIETARMTLWCAADDERWPEKYQDALLWSLSALLARKWFKRLEVLTDSRGAKFFDDIELPFDSVSTDLDRFPRYPFWAAGKIRCYQLANEPFVHLDHDAFLLKPLPRRVLAAAALAQSTESTMDEDFYPLYQFADLCGDLPFRWRQAIRPGRRWAFQRESLPAYNAGILGGNDVEGIQRYAANVFRIADKNPRLSGLGGTHLSIILEQFGFGVELGQSRIETLLHNTNPQPYKPMNDMEQEAIDLGYCHLCGEWKQDAYYRKRVRDRLKVTFPAQFDLLKRIGLLDPIRLAWRKKDCVDCEPIITNAVYQPPAPRSRPRVEARLLEPEQ